MNRKTVILLSLSVATGVLLSIYIERRVHSIAALNLAESKATALAQQLQSAETRARESDRDARDLLSAISLLQPHASEAGKDNIGQQPAPGELVRFRLAQELAAKGQHEAALAEYRWCFEHGGNNPQFIGIRRSFLLHAILQLGQQYPPALNALQEWRNSAEMRILKRSPGITDAAKDLAAINQSLGEDARTVALYDQLPATDPAKAKLSLAFYAKLAAAQNYKDAVQALNVDQVASSFERTLKAPESDSGPSMTAAKRAAARNAALGVEVLAGSGDLPRAQALIGRILAADSTKETRTLLRTYAARAGHPELLPP